MWRTHVYRSMLKALPAYGNVQGWTHRRCIQAIYLFGLNEQFREVTGVQDSLAVWQGALNATYRAPKFTKTGTCLLAIDWIRHHCTRGKLFAIPDHLIRFVPYFGYKPHCEKPAVLDDILALSFAEELASDHLDMAHVGHLVVFKVVNALPNRRFIYGPTHMQRAPNSMAVSQYDVVPSSSAAGGASSISVRPRCNIKHVDISFWTSCHFPDILQNLWTFGETNYDSMLNLVSTALEHVQPSVVKPLPIERKDQALLATIATGDMLESHTTPAYRFLTKLVRSDAFSELGNFMEAETKLRSSIVLVCLYFQTASIIQ